MTESGNSNTSPLDARKVANGFCRSWFSYLQINDCSAYFSLSGLVFADTTNSGAGGGTLIDVSCFDLDSGIDSHGFTDGECDRFNEKGNVIEGDDEENARIVIDKLRGYRSRVESLMTYIGTNKHLSPKEIEAASALYKSLKDDLRAEAKLLTTVHGEEALTDLETAFYSPAVRKASSHLNADVSSDPIDADWYGELSGALTEIDNLLIPLEEKHPEE